MFKKDEAIKIGGGKAKDIYEVDGDIVFVFTDRTTAFDGLKKAEFAHKGEVCCRLSAVYFKVLEDAGILTQFIELIPPDAMRVKKVEILPVEVICRNFLTGSLWKRYKEGTAKLPPGTEPVEHFPIDGGMVEFTTKFEERDRPVEIDEIIENGWLTREEIDEVTATTRKINEVLKEDLEKKGIVLADFKIEYGKDGDRILLADEVGTPDGCRFWDLEAFKRGEYVSLDKDVFREGKGDLSNTYLSLYERITGKKLEGGM
ncbi:MAG: Phosphoribosylaminoimidazole-succinocarboxamide synthase [Candidatus Syntrophoarchaeum sp. GoM_oil]|nr:MAG: Phosphoribosylaminoimidazole-succinocarboxamide synthase [Candidatus Syntrophoarchaeum sp. GoM_oil]